MTKKPEHRPKFPFAYPRPTVQEIVMMGSVLCGIKEQLGHGKFIEWVNAECSFSYRTAHRYMRVFRYLLSICVALHQWRRVYVLTDCRHPGTIDSQSSL
jgi:hypothetical protein